MDTVAGEGSVKLGSTALESILCRVSPIGVLGHLVPHAIDAWSIEFPGLESLPRFDGDPARLRICIATEDIVGPVRNGGIGTTYSALAELLARLGHEVTILYLKGHDVENGTVEQWIDFYAAKSVRFVPVPNYAAADRFTTGADRWLHAPYNMLKYLTDHPMDVVHVSEWRGSGYLCLLAKRQRLAFQQTLFVVKTSSPWMWNRLYGSQPLDRLDDLAKVHAERRSVEFADMVIGGSLHLLRWMSSQGYRIPRDQTFVQPNVATFEHLADLMNKRQWDVGKRHAVDELVFFGRLEARKGLLTFVQAIKRLLRQGVALPRQITFMGKPGARLMARPDQDILDFIRSETANWPTKIEILSEFQQYEALQYLLSGDRLAVMPSMIENSSLAVYEAAICGIPFIASNSGGTPELIDARDHADVLCDAHPIPLATKIAESLEHGGYVARPSFDNDANLETWRRFHVDLGRGLLEKLVQRQDQPHVRDDSVSICIYHSGTEDNLRLTLTSVKEQDHPPAQVLVAVDTDDTAALDRARAIAQEVGLEAELIPTFDLDSGQSFNVLADHAHGEFLLFLWAGATIRPLALRTLTKVAESSNADLLNYFFRVTHPAEASGKDHLSAIVLGNVAQSFFRSDITSLPLLVRRRTFIELEGFTSDYRVLAHDYELVAKAQISGVHCETALLELGTVPAWDEEWLRLKCYDQGIAQFRAIRPELAAAPLALRELLLMAKGLQNGVSRRGKGPAKPRPQQQPRPQAEKESALGRLLTVLSADLAVRDEVPPQPVKDKPVEAAASAGKKPAPSPAAKDAAARRNAPKPQPAPKQQPAKPAPGVGSGTVIPLEPRAVAKAARQDVKAARAGGLRGAGLVQLLDELSADAVEEDVKAPAQREVRRERLSDPRQPIKRHALHRPVTATHMLSNHSGARYSGRLLGIFDGMAYGWVRNEDTPDQAVDVEVVNERGGSEFLKANLEVPTVVPLPAEIRNNGFAVPLWTGWKTLQRYRKVKMLEIRVKGTDVQIGALAAHPDPAHLNRAGFEGYCDIVDSTIRGWVWQPSNPEQPVDVAVFVDQKFLVRATAEDLREDLRAAQIGTGAHGFAVTLPPRLRDGAPRNIDVVVADAGVLLKRGRLLLVGNTLSERD